MADCAVDNLRVEIERPELHGQLEVGNVLGRPGGLNAEALDRDETDGYGRKPVTVVSRELALGLAGDAPRPVVNERVVKPPSCGVDHTVVEADGYVPSGHGLRLRGRRQSSTQFPVSA